MPFFTDAILSLEDMGLTDLLLPFALFFTLMFAILNKSKIFGEDKKNINLAISLAIALIVVIPHTLNMYPAEQDPVVIINNAFGVFAIFLVAIIGFLLILGIFGGKSNLALDKVSGGAIGLAVLMFINFAFPQVPFWVALLSLFLILLFSGSASSQKDNLVHSGLVFLVLVAIGYIIGIQMGLYQDIPDWMKEPNVVYITVTILVMVGVAAFISIDEK